MTAERPAPGPGTAATPAPDTVVPTTAVSTTAVSTTAVSTTAASTTAASTTGDQVAALFRRREQPVREFAEQAGAVAAACHQMAIRFHEGGKLIVFGTGGPSTDAQHVAVEFVHPVIVGKRALPAISLTSDIATVTGIAARSGMAAIFAHQLRYLATPADIALGISSDGNCASVLSGLLTARELGLLTIALVGGDGGAIAASPAVDHLLVTRSADPRVVKEMHVTSYHVLWELVHVFFEQPGVLGPGVVA
jgi:D-sedoheptulose 7-phosphate isomerase